MASEKGNLALADAMLQAGADVNLASLEGVTPLMAACYGGYLAVAQRLIAAGAHTEPIDRLHRSAMVTPRDRVMANSSPCCSTMAWRSMPL